MTLLGWPSNSRFGSSAEMFSFSLNPEVVSLFWRSNKPSIDYESTLRCPVACPSQLFQILLFSESEESATFLSTLHCTVVTTGILVIVGLSSISVFKLIQCLQYADASSLTFQNVKSFVGNLMKPFLLHWRRGSSVRQSNLNSPYMAKNNNENGNGRQLCKRPSELRILSNGSPRGGRLPHSSRENSLERRLLTKDPTPLADCDIASGEEDIADIQGQYFGPTVRSATFCVDLLGSSPEDSPIHSSPRKASAKNSPNKGKQTNPGSC